MPRESRVCENKRQRSLNNYEDTRRDICHKRHPILIGWRHPAMVSVSLIKNPRFGGFFMLIIHTTITNFVFVDNLRYITAYLLMKQIHLLHAQPHLEIQHLLYYTHLGRALEIERQLH